VLVVEVRADLVDNALNEIGMFAGHAAEFRLSGGPD
jgi:hypothetical protein